MSLRLLYGSRPDSFSAYRFYLYVIQDFCLSIMYQHYKLKAISFICAGCRGGSVFFFFTYFQINIEQSASGILRKKKILMLKLGQPGRISSPCRSQACCVLGDPFSRLSLPSPLSQVPLFPPH